MANFCPITAVYAFSATNSAGTPIQVNAVSSSVIPNSYLIENIGSTAAYIIISDTRANAIVTIPDVSPGNAIFIPALSTIILAGPPSAFFNAKTSANSTTMTIVGGLSSN